MKLTITIEMDNAAFQTGVEDGWSRHEEVERILFDLCRRVSEFNPGDSGKLRDVNGNTVGLWEVAVEGGR